jgi:hypothetical protein
MNYLSTVIPGRREAANPESIFTNAAAYGFRVRACGAFRNDEVNFGEVHR